MAKVRAHLQLAEAVGAVNKWYCSEKYGRSVEETDLLLAHFIKNGGATDFARRFEQAVSRENRCDCSKHHGTDISDPEILWNHYTRNQKSR